MKNNIFFVLSLSTFLIIGVTTQFSVPLKIVIIINAIIVLINAIIKLGGIIRGKNSYK